MIISNVKGEKENEIFKCFFLLGQCNDYRAHKPQTMNQTARQNLIIPIIEIYSTGSEQMAVSEVKITYSNASSKLSIVRFIHFHSLASVNIHFHFN